MKNNVLKDFLYLCLGWSAALDHGKIEGKTVNRGIGKYLKFPSLGSPHGGKREKTPLGRILRGGNLGKKMQITVQNVVWMEKRQNKPAVWAATHAKRGELFFYLFGSVSGVLSVSFSSYSMLNPWLPGPTG